MKGEEEEIAHQRGLAARVLGVPVVPVMKAAWEAELQDCMDRGEGDGLRAHQLRRFLLACAEDGFYER
jgi:hypothetical protein